MKQKYLILPILFILSMNIYGSFPPKDVKNAIEKYCQGKVIAVEKDTIKNNDVFIVTCSFKNTKVEYFFSRDGRLIHENSFEGDEEQNNDDSADFESIKLHEIPKEVSTKISSEINSKDVILSKEITYVIQSHKDEIFIFNNQGKILDQYENDEEEFENEVIENFEKVNSQELPDRINNYLERNGSKVMNAYMELLYFAETEIENHLTFYVFNNKGNLLEKETEKLENEHEEEFEEENEFDTYEELSFDQLPKEIKDSIKKHVKGKNLEYGREITYFVETEEDQGTVLYIFNKDGQLVERETETEADEKDFEEDE